MADKLLFELVSPERMLMSRDVDQVTVPGTEGEFGVLARHAPLMSSLLPGVITVLNDNTTEKLFVRGGFAQVTPEGLTVLAEHAVPLDELDGAALDAMIAELEPAIEDIHDYDKKLQTQHELEQLKYLKGTLSL